MSAHPKVHDSIEIAYDAGVEARREFYAAALSEPSSTDALGSPNLPQLPSVTRLPFRAPYLAVSSSSMAMTETAFQTYAHFMLTRATSAGDLWTMLGAMGVSHVAGLGACWSTAAWQAATEAHWRLALASNLSGAADLACDVKSLQGIGAQGLRMDLMIPEFIKGLLNCPRRLGAAIVTGYFVREQSASISSTLLVAAAITTSIELVANGVIRPRFTARTVRRRVEIQEQFNEAGPTLSTGNKQDVVDWYHRCIDSTRAAALLDSAEGALSAVVQLTSLGVMVGLYVSAGWLRGEAWDTRRRTEIVTGAMLAYQLGSILAMFPTVYAHWNSYSQQSKVVEGMLKDSESVGLLARVKRSKLTFDSLRGQRGEASFLQSVSERTPDRWRVSGENGVGKSTFVSVVKMAHGPEAALLPARPLLDESGKATTGHSTGEAHIKHMAKFLDAEQQVAPILMLDEWRAPLHHETINALDEQIDVLASRKTVVEVVHDHSAVKDAGAQSLSRHNSDFSLLGSDTLTSRSRPAQVDANVREAAAVSHAS